jgi:hypothetical protein
MITETVYLERDNAIGLQLLADGVVVSLASVTRMEVIAATGAWSVDSAVAPDAFDWSAGNGMATIALGQQNIPAGRHTCRLVVYDPSNQHGIVWDEIKLHVKE